MQNKIFKDRLKDRDDMNFHSSFKWTVNIIASHLPLIELHVRLTTVPFKALFDRKWKSNPCFSFWNLIYFNCFFNTWLAHFCLQKQCPVNFLNLSLREKNDDTFNIIDQIKFQIEYLCESGMSFFKWRFTPTIPLITIITPCNL